MANIAHNTYLFYGDKDELVKCHKMLNDIYEKVGSDESCVDVISLVQNPEWISYIDDINPGLDNRFYMVTESKNIEKLPQVLKDASFDNYICGTFLKDEVFNSEFQPSDLPDCITYKEYNNVTYDEIRASDEAYLAKWSGIKESAK